jgi:PAS domain S-box-containing protein/putative nucleotidyltransferase with HDIG domain
MKVLYVEDDPFDADLTRRALAKTAPHFKLQIARTQREAMACLDGKPDYDLMLTDLRLPDGSGFALLSHVRDRALPIAVVVITGQGDEEIAVSVLKAGADDYLVKRQDYLERLALTLENALQRYQAEIARRERPLRVLYLDNNLPDVESTRRHFSGHAPHIYLEIVYSEAEVFQRLPGGDRPVDYDVLMLDYRLQNLNALDWIKELRQVRGLDLPIVLVTGNGDEELAAQALRLGASDYVVKNPGYLIRLPGLLENAHNRARLQREQAALRSSEERFRRLAENAPVIIYRFRLHPEMQTEYISPALLSMTGYRPDDVIDDPQALWRLIHPEDTHVLLSALSVSSPLKEPVSFRMLHKDGSLIWVENRSVPIYDEAGNMVAHEGILLDITERKRAEEHIQRQLQRLNALRSVDTAITGTLELRVTLNVLLEQVIKQLGVHAADVLLYDPDTGKLNYSAGLGFKTARVEKTSLRLGDRYAGVAALERRTIYLPDQIPPEQTPELTDFLGAEGFVAYLGTPLVAKDQLLGVLEIFHRSPLSTNLEWLNFLETLAGQAAIALDNAQMFEEITEAYDNTLKGWVRALDLRDEETQDHTARVTEMTVLLAEWVGIDGTALQHVRRGALLHDIGKMGIPDSILRKPGPLTDSEWLVMRRHPIYAHELLSPIKYLLPALDIPYCHHEKWDGSGYPHGLKGEEIPFAARVFAIVDVWDALSTDRPYRRGWPQTKVMEFIRLQSGQHFDPQVVDQFQRLLEKLIADGRLA